MRTAFIETLVELAGIDPRIVLLTGDLGYMFLDRYSQKFPDRFYNVGIAEQNMIGIATGLAEAGYIPYVYSIAPFAVLRPYEFIRNGPIAHHLPVRIIGMGGGVDYSTNGLSHYALEDLGVMRIQPGISVIAPADSAQTRTALKATWDQPGPIYFSLGKDDRIEIPGLNGRFENGKVEITYSGDDLVIFSIGSITSEVVNASRELISQGIHPTLAVVSSLNPVDSENIAQLISHFRLAVSVEARYINGGMGSLIAEVIAENGLNCRLVRCGFKEAPDGKTGSLEYLYQKNGLSASKIAKTILSTIEIAEST